MSDNLRLVVDLVAVRGPETENELVGQVPSLHRVDDLLVAYADTQREAERLREDAEHTLRRLGESGIYRIEWWDAARKQWRDLELVSPQIAEQPEPPNFSRLTWAVEAKLANQGKVNQLAVGLPPDVIVAKDGKHLIVAMEDRGTAEEIADQLRAKAPADALIAVKPLTGFRGWRLRERIFGNYAQGTIGDIGIGREF